MSEPSETPDQLWERIRNDPDLLARLGEQYSAQPAAVAVNTQQPVTDQLHSAVLEEVAQEVANLVAQSKLRREQKAQEQAETENKIAAARVKRLELEAERSQMLLKAKEMEEAIAANMSLSAASRCPAAAREQTEESRTRVGDVPALGVADREQRDRAVARLQARLNVRPAPPAAARPIDPPELDLAQETQTHKVKEARPIEKKPQDLVTPDPVNLHSNARPPVSPARDSVEDRATPEGLLSTPEVPVTPSPHSSVEQDRPGAQEPTLVDQLAGPQNFEVDLGLMEPLSLDDVRQQPTASRGRGSVVTGPFGHRRREAHNRDGSSHPPKQRRRGGGPGSRGGRGARSRATEGRGRGGPGSRGGRGARGGRGRGGRGIRGGRGARARATGAQLETPQDTEPDVAVDPIGLEGQFHQEDENQVVVVDQEGLGGDDEKVSSSMESEDELAGPSSAPPKIRKRRRSDSSDDSDVVQRTTTASDRAQRAAARDGLKADGVSKLRYPRRD